MKNTNKRSHRGNFSFISQFQKILPREHIVMDKSICFMNNLLMPTLKGNFLSLNLSVNVVPTEILNS